MRDERRTPHARRYRVYLAIAIVLVVVLLSCRGIAGWLAGPAPRIPNYPDQQLARTRTEKIAPGGLLTIAEFQTPDTRDVILDFYRANLGPRRKDWREEAIVLGAVFHYNEEYWGQPTTTVTVSAWRDPATGLSEVIVRHYHSGK